MFAAFYLSKRVNFKKNNFFKKKNAILRAISTNYFGESETVWQTATHTGY